MQQTDYFGRTICNSKCPAYFEYDNEIYCNANLRTYPDKYDRRTKTYSPLCKIPPIFKLIKND